MRISQEEIFGPVAAVIKFTDNEDALRIANNTTRLAGDVVARSEKGSAAW
jgi:acyl-CoA reductase-like NAD-dependent aldehyde dehydrogenase